jgi:signal transduction histidine kinase
MLATLFAILQTRRLEANARDVVDNMLTSVHMLGQLESEVERRRILVDDHIFAANRAERDDVEAQLAAVDRRVERAMRTYDPWATLPGERATWERTRADLMTLDAPIARALVLSRDNRDAEAHGEMQRIGAQFLLIDRDFDELIAVNDQAAGVSRTRFSMIRVRLVLTLAAIGLAALAGTVLVGRWAARQIAQREAQMTRDARRLEARNRELDAFAGRVAHDIRNALSTITLAMSPLGARLPAEDRGMQILHRGTRKMEELVDDLLSLARIETLARGQCDPAAVVAQVAQDVAPRVEAEQGALRVAVDHAAVACSEGLLRQAVTNLIENAVKYHRPDLAPEVRISGERTNGGYDLRVTDNGVGMSKEDADRAFEPFYRSPHIRNVPGTGLGLSIVNRVAEASGGRLSVESHLGQGSTFVVHLPLADERSAAGRA